MQLHRHDAFHGYSPSLIDQNVGHGMSTADVTSGPNTTNNYDVMMSGEHVNLYITQEQNGSGGHGGRGNSNGHPSSLSSYSSSVDRLHNSNNHLQPCGDVAIDEPSSALSVPNGNVNGDKRCFSGLTFGLVNGTGGSPGKRKSRSSRDNSPVPPAFSRQSITSSKVEQNRMVFDEPKLTKEEMRSINLRNQNMRQVIYKEVKRPGKNHDRLLQMLREELHGPPQVRRSYIREVIAEAGRFKRKALADLLEQKMEELVILAVSS